MITAKGRPIQTEVVTLVREPNRQVDQKLADETRRKRFQISLRDLIVLMTVAAVSAFALRHPAFISVPCVICLVMLVIFCRYKLWLSFLILVLSPITTIVVIICVEILEGPVTKGFELLPIQERALVDALPGILFGIVVSIFFVPLSWPKQQHPEMQIETSNSRVAQT